MQVVVAEDNPDIRAFIAMGLRCDGHDVVEVSNGIDLRGIACADPGPDLIISDIRMPGLSGFEALSGLRRTHRDVPVVVISAYDDADSRAEATRLGVEVFVKKPFDIFELRETVWNILEPRKPNRRHDLKTVGPASPM